MAVGAPIRVCVLEGLYGQLASLGFSPSIVIELQTRGLPLESAIWTMHHSTNGFLISLFWPGYQNQGYDRDVDSSKPRRRRRRRRRRRPRSSRSPASTSIRCRTPTSVVVHSVQAQTAETQGSGSHSPPTRQLSEAEHADHASAGSTILLSSVPSPTPSPGSTAQTSESITEQDFNAELESSEPDSPAKNHLSQLLKNASSVSFELWDNIPGVSYSTSTSTQHHWTPVSVRGRHTSDEYDSISKHAKVSRSYRQVKKPGLLSYIEVV